MAVLSRVGPRCFSSGCGTLACQGRGGRLWGAHRGRGRSRSSQPRLLGGFGVRYKFGFALRLAFCSSLRPMLRPRLLLPARCHDCNFDGKKTFSFFYDSSFPPTLRSSDCKFFGNNTSNSKEGRRRRRRFFSFAVQPSSPFRLYCRSRVLYRKYPFQVFLCSPCFALTILFLS